MSELSTSNEWATPKRTFGQWHALYRFDVDAAAAAWNAKLDVFWSKRNSGLQVDPYGLRCWCNPPYSAGNLMAWSSRALETSLHRRALWGLHVPASTSDGWWWKNVSDPLGVPAVKVEELMIEDFAAGHRRTWPELVMDVWFYKGRQRHREKSGATGSARHSSAFIVMASPAQWLTDVVITRRAA